MVSQDHTQNLRELSRNSLLLIICAAIAYAFVANRIYGAVPPFVLVELPVYTIICYLALWESPPHFHVFALVTCSLLFMVGFAAVTDTDPAPWGPFFLEASIVLLVAYWILRGVWNLADLPLSKPEAWALVSAITFAASLLLSVTSTYVSPLLVTEPRFGPILSSIGTSASWYLNVRKVSVAVLLGAFMVQAVRDWRANPFEPPKLPLDKIPLPLGIAISTFYLALSAIGYPAHFVELTYRAAKKFIRATVPQLIVVGLSYVVGTVILLAAHWFLYKASAVMADYLARPPLGQMDWSTSFTSFRLFCSLTTGGLLIYAAAPLLLCITSLEGNGLIDWGRNIVQQVRDDGYPLYRANLIGLGYLSGFIVAFPVVNAFAGFGAFSTFCVLFMCSTLLIYGAWLLIRKTFSH
jgi:hypothetical protein